ncbi:peptidase of plants and bacteria-domain-containing protein [Suillus lakei]|nr:peptidase of plants and bacteria-domain-containing protein [Suillus lakei]
MHLPMPPHDLPPPPPWVIPNFVLRVEDLSHPGASIFFDCVKPKEALKLAVEASYTWLYTPLTAPTHVKTITLVLRPFDGVAYTCGTHEMKEINFSLDWIKSSEARARDEILGVLVHEVVHCYQYNAQETCPRGSYRGHCRLHAGFIPPHWRPRVGEKWDAGYDATAYFLDWIEKRCGEGTIRKLQWIHEEFEIQKSVSTLYTLYCEHLEQKGKIYHT